MLEVIDGDRVRKTIEFIIILFVRKNQLLIVSNCCSLCTVYKMHSYFFFIKATENRNDEKNYGSFSCPTNALNFDYGIMGWMLRVRRREI